MKFYVPYHGINRFILEPNERKPNDVESDQEYLAVDDDYDDIESNKEAITAITSITSSTKPKLSNFSVLSLLGRRSPDNKEEEKQSLADNSSNKEIHFPSSEDYVAEEGIEVDKVEQSRQVGKGKL